MSSLTFLEIAIINVISPDDLYGPGSLRGMYERGSHCLRRRQAVHYNWARVLEAGKVLLNNDNRATYDAMRAELGY